MSIVDPKNLAFIQQIPVIGARLYESLRSLQQGINAIAIQGNLNPTGQVEAPPPIQSVNATGQNGVLHVSIEHTAADLRRGVSYYVEHADNPSFINSQQRNIGDSRSYSEFVGNQDRYVRAYAAYPGSPAGAHAYHGSAVNPQVVNGGGSIGPPAYLPSQGAGTGAPGQSGMGPGPVPIRTDASGFDWRLQRAQGAGGFSGIGSPGSQGGASGSSGGGGGTPVSTQSLLADTHANRLTNYPSIKYPLATEFYETDRTVFYWTRNASGTVTVTGGTTVTWVSGNKFINTGSGFTAAQWPAGTQIVINGITCHVATVASSTSLTLQTATTNAIGVSYLVISGRWVYLDDVMKATLASKPTDLGENDVSTNGPGFQFYGSDYRNQWEWLGTIFQFAAGCGSGQVVIGKPDGTAPNGGLWAPCDGTAATVSKDDATTSSVTTQDLTGNVAILGDSSSSAQIPASRATWEATAKTDSATTGITVDPHSTASDTTVTGAATRDTTATHTVNDGGHFHALTNANAQLKVPSEANGGLAKRINAVWYIRR